MTSAATFFPAKLTEPASGDFQADVNFGRSRQDGNRGNGRRKRSGE